jgi:hypothetical protein
MSSYHYSEISSCQINTLVIAKRVITTYLNIEIVQFGVNFKAVEVGMTIKGTNKQV